MSVKLRHQLLLVLICAVTFLVKLGGTQLWDDDETFFARCAVEMQERGDLLVPYFNGEVFVHKPPIMYWGMIAAFKVFGVNEFAVRFPAAIFGCATALLLYHLGRRIFSPTAGFWGAAALATCLNFSIVARSGTSDAELTFFITLPLWFFVRGTEIFNSSTASVPESGGSWSLGKLNLFPSWTSWALAYAAMGAAMMVKGPIGVLLPTCVLGLYLLFRQLTPSLPGAPWWKSIAGILGQLLSPVRFLKTVWRMRPLTAIGVVAAVAGPWYAWVSIATEGAWPAGFFGTHHFGRFLTPLEGHAGSPLYYPAAICVGFFPWVVLIGPALFQMASRLRSEHPWRPGYLLICSWAIVWIGFFTISGTKLPHYVIPAYPALALLTGTFLDGWISQTAKYRLGMQRAAWGTIIVAGLGMILVLPLVARRLLGGDEIIAAAGFPLIIGGIIGLRCSQRNQPRAAATALLTMSMAFVVGVLGFAAEFVDRHQTSRAWAQSIRARASGTEPILAEWGYFRPSILFYAQQNVSSYSIPPQVQEFFVRNPRNAFLFTTEEEYPQMLSVLPADVTVLERRSRFPKAGEVLLLGRVETPHAQSSGVVNAALDAHSSASNVVQASATSSSRLP